MKRSSAYHPGRFSAVAVGVACVALAGTVVSPGAWAGTEAKAKHTTSTTQLSGATAKQLKSLTSSLGKAEKRTFKAVYTITANGTNQSVTIEQQPPKSRYSFGSSGSIIDTGTATYFCSTSGGQVTCIPESSGSNPLSSLLDLFSPATVQTSLQSAEAQLAAKAHGYTVSFSKGTFAGQASKCAKVSGPSGSGKYCVTNAGILASLTSSSGGFTLTSYSGSVPSSDFSLPPGATVVTLP
jgi:outer membrane lipoprotein-sorting protein